VDPDSQTTIVRVGNGHDWSLFVAALEGIFYFLHFSDEKLVNHVRCLLLYEFDNAGALC
jgi:hypothetical protein